VYSPHPLQLIRGGVRGTTVNTLYAVTVNQWKTLSSHYAYIGEPVHVKYVDYKAGDGKKKKTPAKPKPKPKPKKKKKKKSQKKKKEPVCAMFDMSTIDMSSLLPSGDESESDDDEVTVGEPAEEPVVVMDTSEEVEVDPDEPKNVWQGYEIQCTPAVCVSCLNKRILEAAQRSRATPLVSVVVKRLMNMTKNVSAAAIKQIGMMKKRYQINSTNKIGGKNYEYQLNRAMGNVGMLRLAIFQEENVEPYSIRLFDEEGKVIEGDLGLESAQNRERMFVYVIDKNQEHTDISAFFTGGAAQRGGVRAGFGGSALMG
jgi:hypothetical protein